MSPAITVEEAMRLYTTGSAYATGEEGHKGALATGMLADFVELSGDPYQTAPSEIAGLGIRSTWVGGQYVFDSSASTLK